MSANDAREALIENIAQFLHDEGGFGDAYPDRSWPDHPEDTGQREGGWVKLVPIDAQAKFRDVARRLATMLPAPAPATGGRYTCPKCKSEFLDVTERAPAAGEAVAAELEALARDKIEKCLSPLSRGGKVYDVGYATGLLRSAILVLEAMPAPQPPATGGEKRAMCLTLTDDEQAALERLMADQELSEAQVFRCALRQYQMDHERRKSGETVAWSGDQQRAKEFAALANHSPDAGGVGEDEHARQQELQEIADGAYGDGPMKRGLARDALRPDQRGEG